MGFFGPSHTFTSRGGRSLLSSQVRRWLGVGLSSSPQAPSYDGANPPPKAVARPPLGNFRMLWILRSLSWKSNSVGLDVCVFGDMGESVCDLPS